MSGNGGSGAFFSGFLIGGLVGAAAALVMTPQSGEKTRLQLQARGIELKTQVDDLRAEMQQKGQGIKDEKLPGSEMKDEPASSESLVDAEGQVGVDETIA